MDLDIGKRLKAFRDRTRTKMPEIAKDVKIAKETLYKWEKGTKPSDINGYLRLHDYLLNKEEQLQNDKFPLDKIKDWSYTLQTPTGLTLGHVFSSQIELIVTITEDAVSDYKPGWKLCLSKVENIKMLVWGGVYYFIDLNKKGILRHVYKTEDENQINLVSNDAQRYPNILRLFDELEGVYEIAGILLK